MLAAVAGAFLVLLPLVLLFGFPPVVGPLALAVLLPLAGMACAVAALRRRERTAAAAVAVHAFLLAIPWAVLLGFLALMPEPCPTC